MTTSARGAVPATAPRLLKSSVAVSLVFALMTAVYLWVGDSTWWGECLTVWPPFVWCGVFAPRIALLGFRRRFRDFTCITLFAALFLLATVEWQSLLRSDSASQVTSSNRVRILTWNVAGAMPYEDLASVRPDIAFLQEIGGMDRKRLNAGPFAGYDWQGALDPGTLSRFPLERLPTEKIGPWQEPLITKATLPDHHTLLLVNARLMLPAFVVALASGEWGSGLVQMHRLRTDQLVLLQKLIRHTIDIERPDATVLCGDFNTPGGIASLAPLTSDLRDIWPEAGVGWGGTMTASFPVSRIDQCWVSSRLRGVRAEVRHGDSDHRMLVVDLEWRQDF